MTDGEFLLQVLADPDDMRTGNKLATCICLLVTDGAELGALEEIEVNEGGAPRMSLTLPAEWFARLAKAIDVGAFQRLSAKKIVERILLPPLPASIPIPARPSTSTK